jgi:acetyltransferase-like isoleucine patch superfamily enzyme
MRFVWALLMIVLPSRLRRVLGRRVLGWDVHPTAYIGRSVILVPKVTLGPGSSIGPMNVIKDIEELRLGDGAIIGSRNWITGFPLGSVHFPHSPNRYPALILGDHAMVTVAHEIDCTDRVELATYATLAGFRCQVLTHSLNLVKDRQETSPVELGERCAVMTGCTILSGTRIPRRAIISAGSVVTTKLNREQAFYRGNPAEVVRDLPDTLRYFHRGEASPADVLSDADLG